MLQLPTPRLRTAPAALLLLASLLASLLAPAAAAQETVSAEELRQRIEVLEGAPGDEAAADLGRTREALAALERAKGLTERAEELRAEAAAAPGRIEALRAELDGPSASEPLELDPAHSLEVLEDRLAEARAASKAAAGAVDELQRAAEQRAARRAELPEEISSAEETLQQIEEALEALPSGDALTARRDLLRARRTEAAARVEALRAERANDEALGELLPLRTDRAIRRLAHAEEEVAALERVVTARRAAEAEASALEAGFQELETEREHPELGALATEVSALRALRSGEDGLPRRIAHARDALEATRESLAETTQRFRSARRRLRAGGLTEDMGIVLRRDFEWLPERRELEAHTEEIEDALSRVQLQLISVEEQREQLADPEAALAALDLPAAEAGEAGADLRAVALELLEDKRDACDEALDDLEELSSTLYQDRELSGRYREETRAFRSFVEENILWVRSAAPPSLDLVLALPGHLVELLAAFGPSTLADAGREALRSVTPGLVLATLAAVALLAARRLLRRLRADMASRVRSYRTDRYLYTLRALVQTLLLAAPLPLVAWVVGGLFATVSADAVRAAGAGLREVAYAWLALRFASGLLVEKGVGPVHFRWPVAAVAAVRRELRWFEPIAVSAGFVYLALDHLERAEWADTIGRLALLLTMGAGAVLSHRLLRERSEIWEAQGKGEIGVIGKTRKVWSFAATALPVTLGLLALFGYAYTALQFELRLRYSLGLGLALVLVNALLMRWLFMTRRRLAVEQALEAKARKAESEEGGSESGSAAVDADKIDIPAVDAQTRRLFRSSVTLAAVIGLYLIWSNVLPALQGLDRVQLLPEFAVTDGNGPPAAEAPAVAAVEAAPAGAPGAAPGLALPGQSLASEPSAAPESAGLPSTLTLADVLLALVFLALTSVAAKNLPALLELALLQRLPLDSGARFAVTTITRYLILLAGLSAISGAMGIGWQQIQWLAAALTFGLAFGLQEIFANFVSGLIILLERPIRVGDIVNVGGIEGRVTQLHMRATTIQDWERRELLVPNKEFITGSVINYTLNDPVTRVLIPIGLAYGSDTKKARKLLQDIADSHPLVLADPAPFSIFRAFGESSLDFELRVYLGSRDDWIELVDTLHYKIDDAFRAAGIEIAFPQRDIHIRTARGLESFAPTTPETSR